MYSAPFETISLKTRLTARSISSWSWNSVFMQSLLDVLVHPSIAQIHVRRLRRRWEKFKTLTIRIILRKESSLVLSCPLHDLQQIQYKFHSVNVPTKCKTRPLIPLLQLDANMRRHKIQTPSCWLKFAGVTAFHWDAHASLLSVQSKRNEGWYLIRELYRYT